MTSTAKNRILSHLYRLKSFGYDFHDRVNFNSSSDELKTLPDTMSELKQFVQNCNLCELSKTRKNVVFGEGNIDAKVMFIGEAPGATEDESSRPFVGRAGQLLTKMIENVLNISRDNVYIANIIKCRPPNNRMPTAHEVKLCKAYIVKQIELVNPKVIVALGNISYQYLSDDDTPISKIRGKVMTYNNKMLIPTYHPSFLLRNPSAKKEAYIDMLKIKSIMES